MATGEIDWAMGSIAGGELISDDQEIAEAVHAFILERDVKVRKLL